MPAGEHRLMLSGRYPLRPDPEELHRCVLEHARELDRNVDHHQAHARRLRALEEKDEVHTAGLTDISMRVAKLSAEFKTTVAVGAGAIALVVPLLTLLVEWIAK